MSVTLSMTRRSLMASAVALGASAWLGLGQAGAESADSPDWLPRVAPELRDLARRFSAQTTSVMSAEEGPLKALRGSLARTSTISPNVAYRKMVISAADQPDVVAHLINARPGAKRGGILHMHGGGFIAGSAESRIADLQDLARKLDCAILSVAYRLAPETGWAGSTDDNYRALLWFAGHAIEFGVDPAKIAVMGDSAGGGHAALLAMRARDRGEVPICLQVLLYPMLDDRTGSSVKAEAVGNQGNRVKDRVTKA